MAQILTELTARTEKGTETKSKPLPLSHGVKKTTTAWPPVYNILKSNNKVVRR